MTGREPTEAQELAGRYFFDGLDPAEAAELERFLADDPAFAESFALNRELHETLHRVDLSGIGPEDPDSDPPDHNLPPGVPPIGDSPVSDSPDPGTGTGTGAGSGMAGWKLGAVGLLGAGVVGAALFNLPTGEAPPLNAKLALSMGDCRLTGDESGPGLNLSAGKHSVCDLHVESPRPFQLRVSENTRIRIRFQDDGMPVLSLETGRAYLIDGASAPAGPLEIDLGDRRLPAPADRIALSREEKGALAVEHSGGIITAGKEATLEGERSEELAEIFQSIREVRSLSGSAEPASKLKRKILSQSFGSFIQKVILKDGSTRTGIVRQEGNTYIVVTPEGSHEVPEHQVESIEFMFE